MFLFILVDCLVPPHPRPIQIHLMFLFIINDFFTNVYPLGFKYISCSYLSFQKTPYQLMFHDSNTSHVLIYHFLSIYHPLHCSYSNTSHVLIYHFGNFPKVKFHIDSNTSHVLIYLRGNGFVHLLFRNSNTSHVLIYRFEKSVCFLFFLIQIHLMFLFII